MKRAGIVPVLLGTIGVFATACTDNASTPSPASSTTASTAAAVTIDVRDFSISVYQGADVLGGTQLQLSQVLAIGKPVILNFWAGSCPPCRREMPDLQQLYTVYGGRVLLLGIDIGEQVGLGTEETARMLLDELKVTYPAGSTAADVPASYEVLGMPTTLFLTPSGRIVKKWTGLLTAEQMQGFTEELLRASSGG